MEPTRHDASAIPVASVIVLASAIGVVFWYQEPLKSSRPVGTGVESLVPVGEDRVQARLWRDPFAAIEAHARAEAEREKAEGAYTAHIKLTPSSDERKTEQKAGIAAVEVFRHLKLKQMPVHHTRKTLALEVIKEAERVIHAREQKGKAADSELPISVLLVLTSGGPYAEDTEMRIRDRYALVSALGAGCFIPFHPEHIHYFTLTLEDILEDQKKRDLRVPYEWYRPRKVGNCMPPPQSPPRVLVLWLKARGEVGVR